MAAEHPVEPLAAGIFRSLLFTTAVAAGFVAAVGVSTAAVGGRATLLPAALVGAGAGTFALAGLIALGRPPAAAGDGGA